MSADAENKSNMAAQGDGKFGPSGWPQNPSNKKKNILTKNLYSGFWYAHQTIRESHLVDSVSNIITYEVKLNISWTMYNFK